MSSPGRKYSAPPRTALTSFFSRRAGLLNQTQIALQAAAKKARHPKSAWLDSSLQLRVRFLRDRHAASDIRSVQPSPHIQSIQSVVRVRVNSLQDFWRDGLVNQ